MTCKTFFLYLNHTDHYPSQSELFPFYADTRNSGRKTAEEAKDRHLQIVELSSLPSNDCKKLCKNIFEQ